MAKALKKRSPKYQGGDAARLMIRLDPKIRAEWQNEANLWAGVDDAPLAPWIKAMVARALRFFK